MSARLDVSGLVAGYGESRVLHGVDLHVEPGSITAVVGANGAGKTTLMRALSGLLPAAEGEIRLDGTLLLRPAPHELVERGVSLSPEGRLVFPDIEVEETLRLGAWSRRARLGAAARLEEMYALFPRLRERRRTRGGDLSGGEQQMLALARALMADPRLLLLDEPSLGLAPGMARRMFEMVATIRTRGVTVLIVEQNVAETLGLADRAYVMENGRIALEGTGAELLLLPDLRRRILAL